jgi:hypothetical protein
MRLVIFFCFGLALPNEPLVGSPNGQCSVYIQLLCVAYAQEGSQQELCCVAVTKVS